MAKSLTLTDSQSEIYKELQLSDLLSVLNHNALIKFSPKYEEFTPKRQILSIGSEIFSTTETAQPETVIISD